MTPGPSPQIRRVGAGATHALRHTVLRPHQTLAEMVYPGDDDPTTGHFAAGAGVGVGDTVIGIVTVSRQPPPPAIVVDNPDGWWRLRGMATAPGHRSRGIGSALLTAAMAHVAAHQGQALWCNARVTAVAFYQRAGFVTAGDAWDEPGLGPHIVMERTVGPPGP